MRTIQRPVASLEKSVIFAGVLPPAAVVDYGCLTGVSGWSKRWLVAAAVMIPAPPPGHHIQLIFSAPSLCIRISLPGLTSAAEGVWCRYALCEDKSVSRAARNLSVSQCAMEACIIIYFTLRMV